MIGRTTEEEIQAKRPPTGATAADGERFLYDLYVGMVEHSSAQVGQLFSGLAQGEILPAVFHCHAGKDRTGIVVALLLETLGVDREVVLDDYELTARYRKGTRQWATTLQRLIDSGMSAEFSRGDSGYSQMGHAKRGREARPRIRRRRALPGGSGRNAAHGHRAASAATSRRRRRSVRPWWVVLGTDTIDVRHSLGIGFGGLVDLAWITGPTTALGAAQELPQGVGYVNLSGK